MNAELRNIRFAERVPGVPQSFIREILKAASDPDVISFAGGLPNPSLFPLKELEVCAGKVFQKYGHQVLQYASTEGYYPLREFISRRYHSRFGLSIPPEQILITSGSQQALDLIGKLFIQKGDQVLLERPSYLGALQSFSMFQPVFKEVSLQADGVDTAQFEYVLKSSDIRAFYTIPDFQNPSGVQYSLDTRIKTAAILKNQNTILIEDDPYGEISFTDEQLPPLYSFLPGQSIMLGSFSKIIAPGLRIGWMAANPEIIRRAVIMKQASDLHTDNLGQYILYEYLSNYNLDEHLLKIRTKYKQQRDVMLDCLETFFPSSVSYYKPSGGMFSWLILPDTITARKLLRQAVNAGILFVPGDTFYASAPDQQTLRLNFSNVDGQKMRKALRTLAAMI